MNSIEKRFNEILDTGKFICTKEEFDTFNGYGYLLKTGNKYATRQGKIVDVCVVDSKSNKLDIDLSGVIKLACDKSYSERVKRIYCMTQESFDKNSSNGMIIDKDGNKYFRIYDNELWLVVII